MNSRQADVVVVGSGAAGLGAALAADAAGASVLVIEKAPTVGGTTALSGGVLWIPGNDHMAEIGVADDRAAALAYLDRATHGRAPDPGLLEVYVDTAAAVLAELEASTPLRCSAPPNYSDYYADLPGGRRAGRSIEPLPIPGSCLGDWAPLVAQSPFLLPVTAAEMATSSAAVVARIVAERRAGDIRTRGSALVTALLAAVLERSVPVVVDTAVDGLVVSDGAVVGVACGGERIAARAGVVLASGGFEWNEAMSRAFLGHPVAALTVPTNEGDGLRMAMEAGAALANMTSYWGQPATVDPTLTVVGVPVLQFVPGRDRPGSIIVNRHGHRFVNEGVAYHDLVRAFHLFDPTTLSYPNEPPVWMVFDDAMRRRTPIMSIPTEGPVPAWVPSAPTVVELACVVGIDRAGLGSTVERFNRHATEGVDPDFGRGTVWFEAFMADGPRPETSLGPIDEPPFYALEIRDGTIGTNGGPRIDATGRVLRPDGSPVVGLYAAGNVSACVFGPGYPGGGATLGPALVFGTLAGRHAAGRRP